MATFSIKRISSNKAAIPEFLHERPSIRAIAHRIGVKMFLRTDAAVRYRNLTFHCLLLWHFFICSIKNYQKKIEKQNSKIVNPNNNSAQNECITCCACLVEEIRGSSSKLYAQYSVSHANLCNEIFFLWLINRVEGTFANNNNKR